MVEKTEELDAAPVAAPQEAEVTKIDPPPKEFIAEHPQTQEELDGMFKYPPIATFTPNPIRKLILSYKILSMRTVTNTRIQNAVMEVTWECIGRDADGNEGSYVGTTTFDTNKLNKEELIDVEKLTEDMVVYWLKESFNERFVDHIHAQITNDINNKKSLVMEFSSSGLPWKK